MLTKRIITCLDVKDGRVVKGVNFRNLVDKGDPIELARKYNNIADELVFLDITATNEKRKTILDLVTKLSKSIFIPITIGGGISSIDDIRNVLLAGADKVAINSGAIKKPHLIYEASNIFGSQCIVVAIDVKLVDNKYTVFSNSGSIDTGIELISWIKLVETLGAGEILLTSIDTDGLKQGFDIIMLDLATQHVNIPIIASGGAGAIEDFIQLFQYTNVDAALAASIFHNQEISIDNLKIEMRNAGLEVRL